ncbi:MAG: hypothetical protein NXH75_04125 [Halobacteriovoraceae bacterium]|nr:hypothetical protein [Halobacteriovoraceae bacterium]
MIKTSLILFSTIFTMLSFPVNGVEENPNKIKELSLEAFVRVYEASFRQSISTYNEKADAPQEFLNKVGKTKVSKFLKKNKIVRLPKMKPKGEGYEIKFQGNRIFISPRLSYQGKILFNQTPFLFRGKNFDTLQKDFQILSSSKKFSLLSLFINDAHAIGPLAFGVYLGVTATIAYFTADDALTMLEGDLESLDEVLSDMKEKKNKCHTDIRAIGLSASKEAPGEQETFKDMKKIEDALKAAPRYDIHIASENQDLHSLIFREFYGKEVNSCQDFGRQWEENAGALNQRDHEGINAVRSNASRKTKEICQVVDAYAGCLYKMRKVSALHNGERRNGNLYNEDTGLYRDQTLKEKALGIIGR